MYLNSSYLYYSILLKMFRLVCATTKIMLNWEASWKAYLI